MDKTIFLFPSEPFNQKVIDDCYTHELEQASQSFECLFFDIETLADNVIKFSKPLMFFDGANVIYRGWMLKPHQYEALQEALSKKGLNLIIDLSTYLKSHYMPNWYNELQNFTMKTSFFTFDEIICLQTDFDTPVFVKDYVKSLTSSEGSIAKNLSSLKEKVHKLKKTRGEIEGGIVLREFIELLPNYEERYFVYQGKAYSRDGIVPEIVQQIATIHNTPFFSIDIAKRVNGDEILIEVGDGQVSDIKKWNVKDFYKIFQ